MEDKIKCNFKWYGDCLLRYVGKHGHSKQYDACDGKDCIFQKILRERNSHLPLEIEK